MDYVKNGACVGGFIGFDIYSLRAEKKMKYATFQGDIKIGNANASIDAKAMLFKNGKISPTLQIEADANATLAQAGVYGLIGNDYVNASGEANVKVGTASASAKAIIRKDELTLKANVGAAAVKGEVKGVITIFGFRITASASGEIGSVGAGAEFSSKSGQLEFGGKASLFAGAGFKIRINY